MLVIRYEDAKSALISHMAREGADGVLDRRLQTLRRKADGDGITAYKKTNCHLCIEAIESFQGYLPNMEIDKIKFLKPLVHYSRLKIAGVSISVSIDLRTEKVDSKGAKPVGAAMFVFSKTGGPDNNIADRCKAITLLVQELLQDYVKSNETLDPTLCMAIDVFNGKVYRARSRQRQLYKTVENSCGEVATMWPSIEPPANYIGPPVS